MAIMSHVLYFYLVFLSGVLTLILSALRSVSIWAKTAVNLGLLTCMRLFEVMAMLSASLSMVSSSFVNEGIVFLQDAGLRPCFF